MSFMQIFTCIPFKVAVLSNTTWDAQAFLLMTDLFYLLHSVWSLHLLHLIIYMKVDTDWWFNPHIQ